MKPKKVEAVAEEQTGGETADGKELVLAILTTPMVVQLEAARRFGLTRA